MRSKGIVLLVLLIAAAPAQAQAPFLRGDANNDGTVSIADVIFLRRSLFADGEEPVCLDAADANDDGQINIGDPMHIVWIIYRAAGGAGESGPIFPEPYPVPGLDPTPDPYVCDEHEIVPGTFTSDLLQVGDVTALPGQTVSVPVYLSNSVPIEGFQFVITYDSSVFSLCPGRHDDNECEDEPGFALDFSGTVHGQLYDDPQSHAFAVVDDHPQEGYFVAAAFQHLFLDLPIPPGENQLVANIRGLVSPDALPGTDIILDPYNGPGETGTGIHRLRNEVTSSGDARYVVFYPRTREGKVSINDNPLTMDFLRADANLSGSINIADPIFTLSSLFNSGAPPACPDAADANDDGELDVGDAILTFSYLFLKEERPLMPKEFGRCHSDTTFDALPPCRYPHCP